MTNQQWWNLVNKFSGELLAIVKRFNKKEYNMATKLILGPQTKEEAHVLWKILDDTWFNAPNTIGLHSIKCWGLLCDLCSEYTGSDEEE